MLDAFNKWINENISLLSENRLSISINYPKGNSDKPGQYVDFDLCEYMARVTIWESGEIDFEILEILNNNGIFYKSKICKTIIELNNELNEFSKLLIRLQHYSEIGNKEIIRIVEHELNQIKFKEMTEQLKQFIIEPIFQFRKWDYSNSNEQYPCWLIIKFNTNIGIVYSEFGHGKYHPFGIISLNDGWFGRDDHWFKTIQDAFIQSGFWHGEKPDKYEVE